ARAMSDTWTRAATEPRSATGACSASARSSRSASRCLSPLPTTRSTPSMPATSPGLVCAQQPVTTRVARRLTRPARLMAWRSESSARAVTVHVLTTTTSAGSSRPTVRNPRASSEDWICCVSTWLSRHPRVANDTVRAALNSAGTGARDRRGLAELAAGRADVLALAPADRGRDAGVEQDRLEREDPRQRRPPEPGPRPVVERGQVAFGLDPAEQAHQPLRVVDGVVDVLEHDVLEEHALARSQRVALDGGHQRREVERAVHRHEPRADLVGGGVERDRQVHLEILAAELVDAGDELDRRNGELARRIANAELRVGQDLHGLHQRRIVREPLPHPPQHPVP